MRSIYIDESQDAHAREYYLGALIVDAPALRRVEGDLDRIAGVVAAAAPGVDATIEFHGHEMFQGRAAWARVPAGLRAKASRDVIRAVSRSGAKFFFQGVDTVALRQRYSKPHPAHELVLAQLLTQIDRRLGPGSSLGSLGLLHADDHHTRDDARNNLREFKVAEVPGFTDRVICNLGDTLFYGPSHASRLLQAADVATYFANRNRNATETHPSAIRDMKRISADLAAMTVRSYVWVP